MVADSSLHSFFDAVGKFFSSLADISWGALALGLLFYALNLTFRSRAAFNVLRAAYPGRARSGGARSGARTSAAYGFNNVVPARGGDVIKLFLDQDVDPELELPGDRRGVRRRGGLRRRRSAILVLIFAFTQGVFPKPPDFSKLNAFDLSFFAAHPRFALFLHHRARGRWCSSAFALLQRAGEGVLGARAPGPDDPARPPPLLPRGLRSCSSPAGCSASRRSGSCSRRSTSAARSGTCCSCSASTRSRRSCRSRPAAPACSRRCW